PWRIAADNAGWALSEVPRRSPPRQDLRGRGAERGEAAWRARTPPRHQAVSSADLSAARKRAASPPVTTRWSKVSDNGSVRCTAGCAATAGPPFEIHSDPAVDALGRGPARRPRPHRPETSSS